MDMIERIVRGIKQVDINTKAGRVTWLGEITSDEEIVFIARAALKALREPTQQMMKAGDKWTNHHADCVYSIWQAMIDTALAGEGKGE